MTKETDCSCYLFHSDRTRVYFQKFNAFKTIIKVFDKLSINCLKRLREL